MKEKDKKKTQVCVRFSKNELREMESYLARHSLLRNISELIRAAVKRLLIDENKTEPVPVMYESERK